MSNINAVWYAESYYPIQAGSIDGTDVLPHDNAVYRALLCSNAGLYDPSGDPKVSDDPYCTLFVARLARHTQENTLSQAMSKYGPVKNIRLVRDIFTGASRGYAFVEFQTERDMRRAYEDAHHSRIDGSEVIVDYNMQRLMPGWIPRRLGGGLGGKKESGQLRFGGRERPFKAPLRPIPHDELKRLGIPPPPEGHYMSRFQVPSPPRRRKNNIDIQDSPLRHRSPDREDTHSRHASKNSEEPELRSRHQSQDRDGSWSRSKHENSEDHKEGSVPKNSFKDRKEKESLSRHRSRDREDSRTRYGDRSKDRVDNEENLRSRERSKEREDRSYKRHRSPSEESEESRHEHYKQHRGHSYKGERSHRHRSRSTRQD